MTSTTYKYPRSIAFIVCNEFCERFNYYGMRTVLVLYLSKKLYFDEDSATVLFHAFSSLVYFCPLFGAIIADSWLGRFKTIFYISIIYVFGAALISIGAIPILHLPARIVTIIGLLLIAIGTGGIKPCVSAFGGDQFKLPEQAKQLATFFSIFYFSINAGSLISTSITPLFRENVHCFGENSCYSLAFGVPSILMLVAVIVFVAGKRTYVMRKPSGNMIVSVINCICYSVKKKCCGDSSTKKEHWLDYGEEKYGSQLVNDTKVLLKILVLYLPLPIFWALFDQQGSRWTFQAQQMDGNVGGWYDIKPDQMQVVNPFLILLFIPLFDYILYPMLSKCGIRRPLQKITIGGLLAAVAFILSGIVEYKLETLNPVLRMKGMTQLRIYNGFDCAYDFTTNISNHENIELGNLSAFEGHNINVAEKSSFSYQAIPKDATNCPKLSGELIINPNKATSYFLNRNGLQKFKENLKKNTDELATVQVLTNLENKIHAPKLIGMKNNFVINGNDTKQVPEGDYSLQYKNDTINLELKKGGSYIVTLYDSKGSNLKYNFKAVLQPTSMHMLWQLPQYISITAGEVMFSVTGLEFSFTQAPNSMKSVLQACWLLTVAVGNLFVVAIAKIVQFNSQSLEFFCFATLMIIDMGIFAMLAMSYKYVTYANSDEAQSDIPIKDKVDKK